MAIIIAVSLVFFTINVSAVYAADCGGVTACNCGDTLIESYVMTGDLDCSMVGGDGLIVGADDIVLDCDEYVIYGDGSGYGINNYDYDRIAILGCGIYNFNRGIYSQLSENSTYFANEIHGIMSEGMYVFASEGWVNISYNSIYDADSGIFLQHTFNGDIISDNEIYNTNIGIYAEEIINAQINNNNIHDNGIGIDLLRVNSSYFTDNDVTYSTSAGIQSYDSIGNTISGGNIYENGNRGVYFGSDSYGSNGNTVTGILEMHDNTNGAIGIEDSVNNIISNNNISNNCGDINQIYLSNADGTVISENNITDGTGYGISIWYTDGIQILNNNISYNGQGMSYTDGIYAYYLDSSLIQNNEITGNEGTGIYLEHSSENSILGNVISDSMNAYGIYIENSDGNNILGNQISNIYDSAIYIEGEYIGSPGGPDPSPFSDHIIKDNIIVDPAQSCDGGCGGIELYDEYNCTIQNNTVTGSGYNGVSVYGTGFSNIVGNTITDYYNMGIRVASQEEHGNNNNVINNVISNTAQGDGSVGIRVATSNNVIANNVLTSGYPWSDYWSDTYGIYIKPGYSVENNTISSNTVNNYVYGIYADDAESTHITENTVEYGVGFEGWELTDTAAYSGTYSWETNYRYDYAYTTLYKDFDFSEATTATVSFEMYSETESGCDYIEVYAIGDYGETYLGDWSGDYASWDIYEFDLASALGGDLTTTTGIRFDFYTDVSCNGYDSCGYEGTFIDDINVIIDGSEDFYDFESGAAGWQTTISSAGTMGESGVYEGIYVSNVIDAVLSNNEVLGYYYGLYASGIDQLIINTDEYHDNYYGMYIDSVNGLDDEDMPLSSIIDTEIYDNVEDGIYLSSSLLKASNTNFNNNGGDTTGIYVYQSTLYMENGNFVGNGGYGIYEEAMAPPGGGGGSPYSVYWILSDDVYCTNNDIEIQNGAIYPTGGRIIAENCTITVAGNEIDFGSGQVGIYTEIITEGSPFGSVDYGIVGDIVTTSGTYTGSLIVNFYNQNPGASGYYLEQFGLWIDATLDPVPVDLEWWMLKLYYTDEALLASGLDEDSLEIQFYNETSGTWYLEPNQGVDTINNYVWANLTHFSIYGLYGTGGTVTPAAIPGFTSPSGGLVPVTKYIWTGGTIDQTMKVGNILEFMIGLETHSAKLNALGTDYATFVISSTPQTVTVNTDDAIDVDVDYDGMMDIKIILNKIESKTAYLTFVKYTETGTEDQTPGTITEETIYEGVKESFILTTIIVLITGIGAVIYFKRVKKKSIRKK